MRIDYIIQTIVAAVCVAMLVWMLQSCRTPQPIVQEKIVEVERVVTNTDTLVRTEPDSASIQALLVCDSVGNVLIKQLEEEQGKNVALQAKLKQTNKGTALVVDCKADSLQVLVDKYKEELIQASKNLQEKTIEVKYIPSFVKWFAWIGGAAVLYVLLRIAFWVYKKFFLKV